MPAAAPHYCRLVLLRHGESAGNAARTFAGWRDVPLTERGRQQAIAVGASLRRLLQRLDVVFTSRLQRAVDTATLAVAAAGFADLPTERRWRLNERHCGVLQGRGKDAVRAELGRATLLAFRSWDEAPPAVPEGSSDDPRTDPHYADVRDPLPRSESLRELTARTAIVWRDDLAPRLRTGANVLVVGHGLAMRALGHAVERSTAPELPEWTLGNTALRAYDLGADLAVRCSAAIAGADDDSD